MRTATSLFRVVTAFAALTVVSVGAHGQNAAPVIGAKAISKLPYVITSPGIYVLKNNLVYSGSTGAAISINANDVTLDLGGHSIASGWITNNSNQSYGILSSGSARDITVRNGRLRAFQYGIYLSNTNNYGHCLVENVEVAGIGIEGINVRAQIAEVRNCVAMGIGYQAFMYVPVGITADGGDVKICDNIVGPVYIGMAPAYSYGISVGATRAAVVARNTVSTDYQGTYGIACYCSGIAGSFISENSVTNFKTGIYIGGSGKYRVNLTRSCNTQFGGTGTAIGSENN